MAIKQKKASAPASAKGQQQNIINPIVTYPDELEQSLIMEIEKELGYEALDFLLEEAYRYAKHKLEWQNKRYNTNHDIEYLQRLTAEVYEQQAFSKYTLMLAGGM